MEIVKEFRIRDILNYELSEDINIFDEMEQGELFVVQDLIKLGNKCDDEEASRILEKALEHYSLTDIVKIISECLIGKQAEENEETVDKEKFKSFSDILEEFYSQIQTVDDTLSFGDFLDMSTRYMYRYSNGLQRRYINKKNLELQSQYNNVGLFMSALAGKLKDCPQLDENGKIKGSDLMSKIAAVKAMTGGGNNAR